MDNLDSQVAKVSAPTSDRPAPHAEIPESTPTKGLGRSGFAAEGG